ncbi:S-layer homology domain-containing protein [Ructibacterium gallinarum]|uniref:S-layer homology domain-containing protein n=1 Tax=Ructibacterium gallinarum TaxID=2779355 RepID=A0A9D5R985_9FIRM|nr:S-layer homology domain-containing protein [Ructibacterium gallinarum]MBE5040810.1 S-layer homology domain-containing protein [Ructibacterium gallinarum]
MKKTKKIIISSAVSFSIAATGLSYSGFAAPFSDTTGHWAQEAIEKWSEYGIIEGFEGNFKPDDAITRAEMAVIIDRLMIYPAATENPFSDLTEDWYKEAVLKAAENEVLFGYDGMARPNDTITREEAAVMLARALHIEPKTGELPFSDRDEVSDWATGYLTAMAEKKYIRGFADGTFAPQETMTRSYTIALLNNTIGGLYQKPGTYTDQVEGIVLVNSPGVIFKNMQISDIVLAPGVGDNKILLQGNSKISGTKVILAGSIVTAGSSNVGGSGGSTGGSGGSSGGSGGGTVTVPEASDTAIIVNSDYAGKEGTIQYNNKKYTYGKNAFGNLREALIQVNTLGKPAVITLTGDLTEDNTLEIIVSDITIDGAGHTLRLTKSADTKKDGIQAVDVSGILIKDMSVIMEEAENGWHDSYGIQAYRSQITLDTVTVSGADAGVLLNGASAQVKGKLNVSGNEFGGIELARGSEAEKDPTLSAEEGAIENTTEAEGLPTIWVDASDKLNAQVNISGMFAKEIVKNDKVQKHFYLLEENLPQDETVQEVADSGELQEAVENGEVEFIRLTEDISTTTPVMITRDIAIHGQGHTITAPASAKKVVTVMNTGQRAEGKIEISDLNIAFEGEAPADWQSMYGIQVYNVSNVVLRNIKASNGNAGLLINGAEVAVEGTLDVSDNSFGGIELGKGVGVESVPKLTGAVSSIINTSEAERKPTIWTDGADVPAESVEITGMTAVENAKKNQNHFYLNPDFASAEAGTEGELRAALQNESAKNVFMTADIEVQSPVIISRNVTLDGLTHTLKGPLTSKNLLLVQSSVGTPVSRCRIRNLKTVFTESAPSDWRSAYAIQVYTAQNTVLENVSANNGNAGILINGADVTFEGTIDVSDNSFGGIEVSKGRDVTTEPRLRSNEAILTNTTEENKKPTIWTDQIDASAVEIQDLTAVPFTEDGKNQTHFYLNPINSAPAK